MSFIPPAEYYHPSSGDNLQAPINIPPRHSNLNIPQPPSSLNRSSSNKRPNPDPDIGPVEKHNPIYAQQNTNHRQPPTNVLKLQQPPPPNNRQDPGYGVHDYSGIVKHVDSYEYHDAPNANYDPSVNHSLRDDNSHHNYQYDHIITYLTPSNPSPLQPPLPKNPYHTKYQPDRAQPSDQSSDQSSDQPQHHPHPSHFAHEYSNYPINQNHPPGIENSRNVNIDNIQYHDSSSSGYQEPPQYPEQAQIGIDSQIYNSISVIVDKIITPGTETNLVTKKDLFELLEQVVDEDEIIKLDSLVFELSNLLDEGDANAETTEALLEALEQLRNYLEETVPGSVVTLNPTECVDTYDEQTLSVFVQREGEARCKKLLHMKKYACWLDPDNRNILKLKRLIVTKKPHRFSWDNVGIISVDFKSALVFNNEKLLERFIAFVGRGKINTLPTPIHKKHTGGDYMNSILLRPHIMKDHLVSQKIGLYTGCRCEFYDLWANKREKIWLKLVNKPGQELMPSIVGTKIKIARKGHKWGTAFSKAKYIRLSQQQKEGRKEKRREEEREDKEDIPEDGCEDEDEAEVTL